MKNVISIFVAIAFIVTTSMPAASHASMHKQEGKTGHAEMVSAQVDCDHHAKPATGTPDAKMPCCDQDKQAGKEKPCCGKDTCKCTTGACNAGIAKLLSGNPNTLASISSGTSQIGFADELIDSALTERLKRPPRA